MKNRKLGLKKVIRDYGISLGYTLNEARLIAEFAAFHIKGLRAQRTAILREVKINETGRRH